MILKHFNYSEFKEDFYQRVKSPELFEVNGVNYLKVIMENLVVRYAYKWKIKPYIFNSFPGLYLFTKRTFYKQRRKNIVGGFSKFLNANSGRNYEIILVDNGRKLRSREDKSVSTYFHNIRTFLESKKIKFLHYIQQVKEKAYDDEFDDSGFREYVYLLPLSEEDQGLISDLKILFGRIKFCGIFNQDEIKHIESGLTVFFQNFRLWNFYLKQFKPKKVILLGHYHNEGLILACKKNKVSIVELQHGLIAPEDIFYVTPEIFKDIKSRALFPDKIFTYGKYWSDILGSGNEFSKEQVNEMGYYLYEDRLGTEQEEKTLSEFSAGSSIVLITTQPALHESFVDYIKKWNEKIGSGKQVKFIVKLHPADKEEWYEALKKYPNVLVTRIRLEVLFRYCTIHLTSYSTTLYDAFRYKVKNYSVNFPECSDYVTSITKKGISSFVEVNEFPELNLGPDNGPYKADDFFMEPDFKLLLA